MRARLDAIVGTPLAVQIRRKRDEVLLKGLGATRTKDFQYQGAIVSGPQRVDHATRAVYARMAYELDAAFPNRLEVEFDGAMRLTSDAELVAILASLGSMPGLEMPAKALTEG